MTLDSKLMTPLVVILGETASGKSALALEIAKRFNGEIICADSWTVYKDFDIGTAKPSGLDRAMAPHHLLDVASAHGGFNAVVFQQLALAAMKSIAARGRLPILVGGTGLYIDSVIYHYEFLAAPPPGMREVLNKLSLDELLERAERQGLLTEGIDTRNKRRVIRLIENEGKLPSRKPLRENTLLLGVSVPRDELRSRVELRVDAMLAAGLEDEVAHLKDEYGWDAEPMKGIGYREWQKYFDGKPDLRKIPASQGLSGGSEPVISEREVAIATLKEERAGAARQNDSGAGGALSKSGEQTLLETRELIIRATMNLAKRQRTWFKRNDSIQWVSDPSQAVDLATTVLNKIQ